MRQLAAFFRWIASLFLFVSDTLLAPRPHERRARYDELKAMICDRHYAGYGGLVVEDKKFDAIDMKSFKAPMYGCVQNKEMKWCIFWDRGKLTREIGTGAPLKDGELMLAEKGGRSENWKKDPEAIDENVPLTQQAVKAPDAAGEGS